MKIYEVELKRTSYLTIEVEAESEDEAKDLAYDDIPEYEREFYEVEDIVMYVEEEVE